MTDLSELDGAELSDRVARRPHLVALVRAGARFENDYPSSGSTRPGKKVAA